MAIRLKIAESAKELDDVFWLRHEVYAEEGYFNEEGEVLYITDRFDAHPLCANIIAYDDKGNPVGTLRVNGDTESGLPADEYYDFSEHRRKIAEETDTAPRFCSAGMLAISKGWRNRRDVIRALFRMAASVANSWDITHVIATINYQSHAMYKRIGFVVLDEKRWIEEIGEFIVPLAIPFPDYYRWASADLLEEEELLGLFSSQFERLVLSDGEYLFREGEQASECYMIAAGNLKITRQDELTNRELTLVVVKQGGLTGELALIDGEPRSANAIASGSTEVMVLTRDKFFHDLSEYPERVQELLRIFSQRIRRMDGLAVVLAYGTNKERLEFALQGFRNSASKDKKNSQAHIAKVGPADLAKSAGVTEEAAIAYLDGLRDTGLCDFSDHWIRFFDRNETDGGKSAKLFAWPSQQNGGTPPDVPGLDKEA